MSALPTWLRTGRGHLSTKEPRQLLSVLHRTVGRMADDWDYDPGDWDYDPRDLDINEVLFGGPSTVDLHAQELFMDAFFDKDDKAYIDLVDYMWDQYGVDFEAAFDWVDFKEWYDSQ